MIFFEYLIDVKKYCWFCIDYLFLKNCFFNLIVLENKVYLLFLDDICVYEIFEDI